MDTTMANDGPEVKPSGTDNRETYNGFISITIKAIFLVAIVLILMAIFLA
jgi:membrane protein required for beta-lactamase induction